MEGLWRGGSGGGGEGDMGRVAEGLEGASSMKMMLLGLAAWRGDDSIDRLVG